MLNRFRAGAFAGVVALGVGVIATGCIREPEPPSDSIDSVPVPASGPSSTPPDASIDAGGLDAGEVDAGATLTCPPLLGTNRLSTLVGAPVGTGVISTSQLRKPLLLSLGSHSKGFSIVRAFLIRAAPTSMALQLIGEVRNDSAELRCRVRLSGAKWEDNALGVYFYDPELRAFGSTAKTGIEGCLAPGEVGYVVGEHLASQTSTFDNITFVNTLDIVWEGPTQRPAGTLEALSYVYLPGSSTVAVNLRNAGSSPLQLGWSSLLFLDSSGAPLYWALSAADPAPTLLAAGAPRTVTASVFGFQGAASQVLPIVRYIDSPSCR